MLESINTSDTLQYEKLTAEECEKRGILGRLVGKIADWKNPTRNGRKYSAELWENVFSSPLVQEKIKNRCFLGELGHPADREEIDIEKVAICLAEQPKKGNDGFLYGVFDILDTPNGKLLKALCDYGCKIGVSSRGSGDIVSGMDGDEVVPDTYDCECFDAVLVPAVEDARPDYVTESLNTSPKQSLSESIHKLVDSVNEKDKPVILETLNTLNIDISNKESQSLNESVIDSNSANDAVVNDEVDLVNELQESLKVQKKLESKVAELQEKLSVCYAKEIKLNEEVGKSKDVLATNAQLTEKVEAMRKRVSSLTEKLEQLENENSELLSTTKSLKESMRKVVQQKSEQISKVSTVEKREKQLREKLNEAKTNKDKEIEEKTKSLREDVAELKKDIAIKESEYSQKIERSKSLVEKYKKIAETATNKYIRCQAMRLNVSESEIRSKLSERSSFEEIDKVCESLQNYVTVSNRLPFDTTKKVRMTAKKAEEPILPKSSLDDCVDDSLIALAKFNN